MREMSLVEGGSSCIIDRPALRTNHFRARGTYLSQEPITSEQGEHTSHRNQSHQSKGNIPLTGTNHIRARGTYLSQEPITSEERKYISHRNQSHQRKGNISFSGTNHSRGRVIYLSQEPITSEEGAYTSHRNLSWYPTTWVTRDERREREEREKRAGNLTSSSPYRSQRMLKYAVLMITN
jgi:hypothetical protein